MIKDEAVKVNRFSKFYILFIKEYAERIRVPLHGCNIIGRNGMQTGILSSVL